MHPAPGGALGTASAASIRPPTWWLNVALARLESVTVDSRLAAMGRESVLGAKWYRQAKLIVAALALAAAGVLGVAAHAFRALPDPHAKPGFSSQCDLPTSQRTGGWVCPSP